VPASAETACVRELAALPAFPELLELRDEQVVEAFRRLPVGKAPGLDDWAAAELRLWPTAAVLGAADLLRAVEREGRWPKGIARAEVVLLPKGCPLAVDVLAIITFAWVAAVGREAPALARRAYVDDLTAWGSGEAAPLQRPVETAWGITTEFAEAFQLTVNTTKTRVVAAPGLLRASLSASLPGVTVGAEVRDLGVLQQLGRLPGSGSQAASGSRLRAATQGRGPALGP